MVYLQGYLYLNIKHLLNSGVIGEGSEVFFPVVREVNHTTVGKNLFKTDADDWGTVD